VAFVGWWTVNRDSRAASLWNRHEPAILAALSVLVAAGSFIGVALFFRTTEPTNRGSARCYTVLSVGSGETFTGTTIAAAGRFGSAEQVQSALTGCADLWREGFLSYGSTMQHPAPSVQGAALEHVPKMVACTLRDRTVGVFPTEGLFTCGKLGLGSPPSPSVTSSPSALGPY
jgi:hypothetical protein